MRWGTIEVVETLKPLFAFRRTYEGQTFTCIYNGSPEQAAIKLSDLPGAAQLLPVSRHAALRNESLLLEPYGYAIFSH